MNKTIDEFDAAENENLINNLTIKFNVECTGKQDFRFLYIPIINGKPFGKDNGNREITFNRTLVTNSYTALKMRYVFIIKDLDF